jgi:hypothetical protein
MARGLPNNHRPEDRVLITTPRLTELAFQTAGIWEIGTTGTMALPRHIDRVVYAGNLAKAHGNLRAIVSAGDGGRFSAVVADEKGTAFVEMSGYETVQLPAPIDTDLAAPLRDAMTQQG